MRVEEVLVKHFGWTKQDINEKAVVLQHLRHDKSEQEMLDKAGFYQEEFKLTKSEFNKMVKTMPAILFYDEAYKK